MTGQAFAEEARRRANVLAWRHNWRGQARAAELAAEAARAGRSAEARLWRAVEARLEPI